jgi:imidazolonepropionase-like amidohydrolase
MLRQTVLILGLLGLCACKPPGGGHILAILGAILIDGNGGPPLSDSVVIVSGDRIAAAGRRANVPVPAEADKIDGSGKYLVPQPIDILAQAKPMHPASAAEARAQVSGLAAQRVPLIVLDTVPAEAADAALETARASGIPVFARISTLAEVRRLVDSGAAGFVGMICDTENLDPVLVSRLRDLRIVFAPALVSAGAAIETAKHNTRKLFQAGVPLAVASAGDIQAELELMADAGVPPLDVLVAATRNGAAALRQTDTGTIEEGKRADLLLLSATPGEDIRNLRRVAMRIPPAP